MARPIKNNADYFSHDAGMRNDPKVKALRKKFPKEGYTAYNMILESLTEADYFTIELTPLNYELMSGDFDIDVELLEQIIPYCVRVGLLNQEDNKIFSSGHKKRLQPVIDNRNAVKQRFLDKKLKQDRVSVTETTQSKVKESKVKESKVYKDSVVVNASEDFEFLNFKNLEKKGETEFSEKKEFPENQKQEFSEFEEIPEFPKDPEIPIDVQINEEEYAAAEYFIKTHSHFLVILKHNSLTIKEGISYFRHFYEQKFYLGELKGKQPIEVLRWFYSWAPKYKNSLKQNTVQNGTANNNTRRSTSAAASASDLRAERKILTNGLRTLLQGTEPKQ